MSWSRARRMMRRSPSWSIAYWAVKGVGIETIGPRNRSRNFADLDDESPDTPRTLKGRRPQAAGRANVEPRNRLRLTRIVAPEVVRFRAWPVDRGQMSQIFSL